MIKRSLFSCLLLVGFSLQVWSSGWSDIELLPKPDKDEQLEFTYENLFLNDDLFGKMPRDLNWSEDGRFLAFRWNINNATGYDIWVYDALETCKKQITSVTHFSSFDPEARTILKSKNSDKTPRYSGVSSYQWAENSNRMLLNYKNDLYLANIEKNELKRLTKTARNEEHFQFTPDGKGYIYWHGSSMYRVRFGDSFIEEISPAIPSGQAIEQKILSPGHKWLVIVASKSKGSYSPRKVGYVTFRDRFAQWKEHSRPLAEDPDPPAKELWIYLQEIAQPIQSVTKESATQIFHHDGSHHLRLSNPKWSEDNRKIVFRTFNPDNQEILIYSADIDDKKAKIIHRARNSGTQRSPNRIDPEFTQNGELVIAMFEDSGFRQPWIIDPMTRGKVPLVRGKFDAMYLNINQKGDTVYVLANKEHPAQKDIYAVDIETGDMKRLTINAGVYSDPAVSEDGQHYAAIFSSWRQPRELAVGCVKCATERLVTQSHPNDLNQLNILQPELFSYKNDEGYTLHGMIFLPPHHKKSDKRPVTIYTYGGPLNASSMVQYGGFGTYNYRFPMYMAKKHGYIAAVIDPRGSSNYGSFFESANWENPGKPQVEDLAAGAKYITKHYGGDADRVALYGWSFGGFVTQMALLTQPDVFAAGMAGAGPTEWKNYYGSYTSVTISEFDDQEDKKKFTIIPLAEKLQDPLMLIHGVEDTNVLFQDTIKMYQAYVKAGKTRLVDLVLDTAGGHHLGGDMKYTEIFSLFEDFLLEHLGSGNIEIANGKSATGSTSEGRHKANHANDGEVYSRWTAEKKEGKPWWQVNLKKPFDIQSMEIHWAQEKAEYKYIIKGMNKDGEWNTLIDKSDNDSTKQKQHLYLDAPAIRKLRIEIEKKPKDQSASIIEVKVYKQ